MARGVDTLRSALLSAIGSGLTDEQIIGAYKPRLRAEARKKLAKLRARERDNLSIHDPRHPDYEPPDPLGWEGGFADNH
jgi:hypothetical protein